jgi:uncharacterized membrane protein YqjE
VTGIALLLAAMTFPCLWIFILWNYWPMFDFATSAERAVWAAAPGIVFLGLGFLSAYGSIRAFKGTFWHPNFP